MRKPEVAPKEQKGDWVAFSKSVNAQLFSELDVLLRSLDRFFSAETLASSEDLAARNFFDELVTARDAILRVLGILEVVMPESRKNAYWFRKFADTKLTGSQKGESFRESLYTQDSTEKSLYLLYDSFINLKGIISDLLRGGSISYMGFTNIGQMVCKEIRENRCFNPFKRPINPEFDIINNHIISAIAKSIEDKELKKQISIIFIYLFRFLRFLEFVDIDTQRSVSLNSALMILILLKSEIAAFRGNMDKTVNRIVADDLSMLMKSVSYQFSMEARRVYMQELKDIHRRKAAPQFRGKIENSHGILKNLTEQSIMQLAQHFRPDIKGEEVFSSFSTKLQQSIRLREDIYVFQKLLFLLESKADNMAERAKVFESLRSYMLYFESFTFRLLRYDDYEEFFVFFQAINNVDKDMIMGPDFVKTMEKIRHFRIYLETTLSHIGNRSELAGRPIDTDKVREMLRQYLS